MFTKDKLIFSLLSAKHRHVKNCLTVLGGRLSERDAQTEREGEREKKKSLIVVKTTSSTGASLFFPAAVNMSAVLSRTRTDAQPRAESASNNNTLPLRGPAAAVRKRWTGEIPAGLLGVRTVSAGP